MNNKQLKEQGEAIQKVLCDLGISCYLRNFNENEIMQNFDFDMADLRYFKKLKSAIEVLNACLHTTTQLAESKTNHFAIHIKKEIDKIYYKDYEQDFEPENKYSALIGIDENGDAVEFNVKTIIHALIGGATGMGKTTLLNNIIYSLAKKNTKDTLQIALIDTKKTLAMWEKLPILFDKPATDGYFASDLLFKIIDIMEKRINKLARMKLTKANDDTFPRILVIVDELADLMLASNRKYVEDKLVRIAQLGRAVNITLCLATQNPIAKVCTSLIKTNCPTKIALKTVTNQGSISILEKKDACLLEKSGEAIMRTADNPNKTYFKCLFMEDEEILNYVGKK